MENELANKFKAKWKWAEERFGFVHVTKAEQKEITNELERLEKAADGYKQLAIKYKKKFQESQE